ncbi:hypothetical protein MUK42_28168 [Musa troglodytarum]|uniref:Uncharacterized protein n=1 Tax=Musa troglodytarum TaxID=320322 RepID=A0A9E7JW67_9LILI|nr:hypothetical protein MUK42_28168 [Musa troglodytarum]
MALVLDQPPRHAHHQGCAAGYSDFRPERVTDPGVGCEFVLVDAVEDDMDSARWDLVDIAQHLPGAVADGYVVGVAPEEPDLAQHLVDGLRQAAVECRGHGLVGTAGQVLK